MRVPSEAPPATSLMPENVGGAERREHQRDRERQADVTDAIDDERLLGRRSGGVLVLPEPDEQVRREADALPAEEQADEVGRQHQHQHRGDEQVEVAEEAATALVVLHVADGVDMDERADTGDQEQEQGRERVVEQVHADVEATRPEPGVEVLADLALRLVAAEQADEQHQAEHERRRGRGRAEVVTPAVEGLLPALRVSGPPTSSTTAPASGRAITSHSRENTPSAAPGSTTGMAPSSSPREHVCRPLSTSAGWRRRPRPSDGSGRWS